MTNKKINKLVSISLPRVKSIDFHPHKSIFIAGLHTGLIKSYTYEGLHLYTFDFHEGSVRSVKFHPNSDFFISGGDDKIIRMFNYTTKELLHLFKGHADFIRSVDFHPSKPWIISSSDDQSIKIWNFLTKKLIATATGHSHYIMSAKFLNEKFIISGSLDQTIRIWEFNQNKSKFVPDVIVKQIIQGHDRGVNCIEIDNDLVVSGGDDREVKIWEISTNISNNVNDNAFNYGSSTLSSTDNSISIKEIDNHFNHQGSITSIKIHDDLIVSSGEDGYLIIYKNKSHSKYKVEGRIWSVAYKDNIYICGHDNGLDILEYKEPDFDKYN
ncbi:wd40 repeat-containing coatomer complex protein [Vairimorpha apis BRL 01]|uniref:Wd40 repeat-containing coatomer complex protein n=1 Tax=Vairimorpha apis BRL 01 TaxID=1037528 RepID=T0MGD6_9MICR|nr:wd40 repeat-containing coatomer complex protein [Vairimorpha apis BRL 01]